MRFLPTSLVVTALLALGAAPTFGAGFRPTASAQSPAVSDVTSGVFAYLATPAKLVVRRPSGEARSFSVTTGCVPTAVTEDAVALSCIATDESPRTIVLIDTQTGEPTLVTGPRVGTLLDAVAIGDRWLIATTQSPGGRPNRSRVAIDRRTGQIVGLGRDGALGSDPFGPRMYLKLDSSALGVSLCGAVRRRQVNEDREKTKYVPVTKIGPWVLQRFEYPSQATLQHCSSRTKESFGYKSNATLGEGVLATLRGPVVSVRDLRTGARARFRLPGSVASPISLAFARSRLLLSVPRPAGTTTGPAVRIYAAAT